MKFSAVVAAVAATGAYAWPSNVTVTTDVVTAFTTYCPEATKLTHNGQTYTVTEVSETPQRDDRSAELWGLAPDLVPGHHDLKNLQPTLIRTVASIPPPVSLLC